MTGNLTHIRKRALIVLHPDGFVEVYGDDELEVRIETMLDVPREGEAMAEDYLWELLPHRWRQVYWPGNPKAVDSVRSIKPSEAVRKLEVRKLFRQAWSLISDRRDEPRDETPAPKKAAKRKVWRL